MEYKSLLHKTVQTSATEFWNDSCAISELKPAIENGATGATTNPVIVGNVLKKEMDLWKGRINELICEMPIATEDDIAWKLNEEMAVKGAKLFDDAFKKYKGKRGRLSIQTNAKNYRNAEAMWKQAVHFNTLAPNMQVKMPVSKAGVEAIEESTYHGVSVNATVSFNVPQCLAVAEAVERGLKRRVAEGKDISQMSPVCTMMVGRLDDWIKTVWKKEGTACDPGIMEWAGIACFKHAYKIYQERKYTSRLLCAAFRNVMHWSEFVGGDVVLTITSEWQDIINKSGIDPTPRMDIPVDQKIVEALLKYFPEFRKAYEPDGLKPEEFADYGSFKQTITQFLGGYASLLETIRGFMIKM
ncbi:MAG: transaldolase family protein [Planctomycetes bacterium]|nr:transaldolase family protein [Planctomycetota bacterium]